MKQDMAPVKQLTLPLDMSGEVLFGDPDPDASVRREDLMEVVVERENLLRALSRVRSNGGSPGIDGMTVDELPSYLKTHWSDIRTKLLEGRYRPLPVKRTSIPKPGGGERKLGIPTVLDRFIQQAMLQVLQPSWDATFSDASYGFRPGRSAHQAIARAQEHLSGGHLYVVDMDLEKFFDRVNHDKLMHLVCQRVGDRRVCQLISAYLKAGTMEDGALHESVEGTPQGGPLSPLLANLLLDRLDKELERRGHLFVRYADDCNIYVKSERAGHRVLSSITRFLSCKLKLVVNQAKSAVDRPWKRTFLGFSFICKDTPRRRISTKALNGLKDRIRALTRRSRGDRLSWVIRELGTYLRGWWAYFGITQAHWALSGVDKWIRRRLRCYLWKQWGPRRYRELMRRGVSRKLAWYTSKSAHGPWRITRSPALHFALPASYFDTLGLPRLYSR